jgi:NAD(P)-dependent dehydrogenase (short-subunit alcohol dehydrogenase family)
MADLLKNKVAIVTGAARGIGQQYALGLCREGARVVVADILDGTDTVAMLNQIAPDSAIAVHLDVSDSASTEAMAKQTVDQFGRVDVLINNAAMFGKSSANKGASMKPFAEIAEADWDQMMSINVKGVWNCTKAVYPYMKAQGYGKIINIASTSVSMGAPYLLDYVTSKGAVAAMTRALARELGPDGIRVNSLAPGFTLSQASKDLLEDSGNDTLAPTVVAMTCLGEAQTPPTLVGTAIYLSSELSDFVTGQILNVDGGANFTSN